MKVSNDLLIYPHAKFDTGLTGDHAQRSVSARLQQRDLVSTAGQASDIDQA